MATRAAREVERSADDWASEAAGLNAELEGLRNRRDHAIRMAYGAGMSLRQVAAAVSLSQARIHGIIKQEEE